MSNPRPHWNHIIASVPLALTFANEFAVVRMSEPGHWRRLPDSPVPHATLPAGRNQQGSWREIAAARSKRAKTKDKWRLLLPGASEPRLTELNPSGLQDGLSNCVTQPEQPEHSCRLQLLHSPITAEPYREKARPLRPRRSYFAPAEAHATRWAWVEAPGTAPGSEWFIATAIYFHSRRTGTLNIGCKG
jgi:hypothetical protein